MIIDLIYPRGFIIVALPPGLHQGVERLGQSLGLVSYHLPFLVYLCMLSHVLQLPPKSASSFCQIILPNLTTFS